MELESSMWSRGKNRNKKYWSSSQLVQHMDENDRIDFTDYT